RDQRSRIRDRRSAYAAAAAHCRAARTTAVVPAISPAVVASSSVVGRVSSVVPATAVRSEASVSAVGIPATVFTVVATTVALLRDDDHFEEGEPHAT
ncbi:hypothetical protein PMAYCL1PPCAC_07793, partial [Pristionchus mayeri]